jgi:CBS domain-containing protein
MLQSVELKDYMLMNPVTISKNEGLFEAVHLILVNKISGLCVIDDDGALVGMLSELDCLQGILGATYNQGAVGAVHEYMVSENIDVAKLGEDIINVATDMLQKSQRRRPVIDANNKLIGQITCRQLLAAVKRFTGPVDPDEQQ